MSTGSTRTEPLVDSDFDDAAQALGSGVSAAIIRAFAVVESGGKSGFGPEGRPVIAYEGHVFRKYTKRQFDKTHPMLSYPYKEKGGAEWKWNNKNQKTAWETLSEAMQLNHEAALLACSWGMFQVMGFNFKKCGYESVESFVAAMKAGERGQLDAFVGFCKNTQGVVDALRSLDYKKLATLYNGKDYGNYDRRIEKAYRKFGGR